MAERWNTSCELRSCRVILKPLNYELYKCKQEVDFFKECIVKVEEAIPDKSTGENYGNHIPTETKEEKSTEDESSESDSEKWKLRSKRKIRKQISPTSRKKQNTGANQNNQLSEFEKMVQKNIADKMALLESLKINELGEEFAESVARSSVRIRQSAPKRPTRKSIKSKRGPLVRRKSQRLAKRPPDFTYTAEKIVDAGKDEIENEIVIPAVLPFKDAIDDDGAYEEFLEDFSELKVQDSREIIDYSSCFENMTINESQIAKVVPARITAIDVHPVKEHILVAAASKNGFVGFWKVNSDHNPYSFALHHQGITNLKFNPYNPMQIISSSYDGTMRCGDFEKRVFEEIYDADSSCTYFDALSSTSFLVSHRSGQVSIVDCRTDTKKSRKDFNCHSFPVKTVSIHPVNPSYFLTCDMKGALRLWDLRKIQSRPVVESLHHKRCVQSAFFDPVEGNSILTTSSDDSVCLFDSSQLGDPIALWKQLRHNNCTGRWLSTFKATWLPNSNDTFVIGSMNRPREIEIYNCTGKKVFSFQDEECLTCVSSLNVFHPSEAVLAGGNSSGKVFVFAERDMFT